MHIVIINYFGIAKYCFKFVIYYRRENKSSDNSDFLYFLFRLNLLKIFRKIDHMMIFVLIAGSYTPVCLITLGGRLGFTLLAVVWGIAIFGIILKACWITCPKWFSSVLYISMGWVCLGVFGTLWDVLPHAAFLWLLIGGIFYTIGGVIYALKLKILGGRYPFFGAHEVFHLFVMAGSICHFIFMFRYVA